MNNQRTNDAEDAAKLLGHTPGPWTALWSAGAHTCHCQRCGATMILTKNTATGPILKYTCNELTPDRSTKPA